MIRQQGQRHQHKTKDENQEYGGAIRAVVPGKVQPANGTARAERQVQKARFIQFPLAAPRAFAIPGIPDGVETAHYFAAGGFRALEGGVTEGTA